ncbi:MAG: signal recognition particle receptor subunit alpha [Proteobacteria bacterium]|nr:signal recognition particle receptor subunit alpha [Pseudomonadota bacterium]
MFDKVASGFEAARDTLRGRTKISETNIKQALESIRKSLLEADVEYSVTQHFLAAVETKTLHSNINLRSHNAKRKTKLTLSQYFYGVCYDALVELLGKEKYQLNLPQTYNSIMMIGLQGVGKTTTAAKLAKLLSKTKKKPLLVACDIYRPAAVEQLKVLGQELGIEVFHKENTNPLEICKAAQTHAFENKHEVMILDTAGRLTLDEELMQEVKEIKDFIKPQHTLLVVDAMMGQDAVKTAKSFDNAVNVDAFILTKTDGDARAGAALSITYITGKPIAFLGVGESSDALESFRPEGISSRILGMGDMLGIIEEHNAANDELTSDEGLKEALAGKMNFNHLAKQIQIMRKLGSLRALISKLPSRIANMIAQGDMEKIHSIHAIIQSMTANERSRHVPLNPSRAKRIASGSGQKIEVVYNLERMMAMFSAQQQSNAAQMAFAKQMMSQFYPQKPPLGEDFNQLAHLELPGKTEGAGTKKDVEGVLSDDKQTQSKNASSENNAKHAGSKKAKNKNITLALQQAKLKALKKAKRKSSKLNRKKR